MLLTIASFVLFTGLVALGTWWLTRHEDHTSSTGFFLAGRKLTFVFISGSLLLTNLSTEQMVGLNGAAFKDGLCVMVWEVVAVLALVAMALFFLPRYLRSGIATVPQFLEERFDSGTRLLTNLIFLLAYAAILLPIILYTGARGLGEILNMEDLTGIHSEGTVLWLTVWFVGIVGSIYALVGGLRTVAVSDTLNGVGLLVGGFLIVVFGLGAVSEQLGEGHGILEGLQILRDHQGDKFNSIGGPNSSVPFFTVFTGIALLNVFYWCTNQQIIQRTFGARNLAEGQKGVLLTGLLKLLGPAYLVLPGIIAVVLFTGPNATETVTNDTAYGVLVRHVLPAPLTGFFAAVMTGAILSSFNSALNSTTTLFSLGIYKARLKPEATDEQVVRSGRIFGWVIALISMTIAPLLAGQDSIFAYLQKMNGIYFIPIFAVALVGMVSRRVPALAAKIALVVGLLGICAGYFMPLGTRTPAGGGSKWIYLTDFIHEYHFLGIAFATLVVLMLVIGALRPRAEPWVQRDSGDVELTPWKHTPLAAGGLVVLVLVIYAVFADFSVLKG